MDFYFIDPSGGPTLHLPVNPEEVTVRRERNSEIINLLNLGEVEFTNGEKLTEISFSSFFPREYDSYVNISTGDPETSGLPDPEEAIRLLDSWVVGAGASVYNDRPVRFLVAGTSINLLVLVAQLTWRYVGGEPGDIYYDIALRTWREVKIRTSPEAPAATRPDLKPVPKVYTVRAGDSLYKIAKMELGSGSKWKTIYDLNAKTIGPDPNKLAAGTKLVMPV